MNLLPGDSGDHYDVAGLCNRLPQRIATLKLKKGDRINK